MRSLFLVVALVLAPVLAQAAELLPARVYGADPTMRSPSLSPDGTKVAYLRRVNDTISVVVTDLNGGGHKVVPLLNAKARSVSWSSPNHVVIRMSQTQNMAMVFAAGNVEVWGTFILDLRTDEISPAFYRKRNLDFRNVSRPIVGRAWDEEGSIYMVALTERGGGSTFDLYKVSGKDGRAREIARGQSTTINWTMGPGERVLARFDMRQKSDFLRMVVPTDEDGLGGWETVYEAETPYRNFSVAGPGEKDGQLVVHGWFGEDRLSLFEMSNTNGEIKGPFFQHDLVDVEPIMDPYTNSVVGAEYTLHLPEQEFFDLKLQRLQRSVRASFPEKNVNLVSWSASYMQVIVSTNEPGEPITYFFIDIEGKRGFPLARNYQEIGPDSLGTVKTFTYTARDDVPLFGYLTLPPGTAEENLPLVMMPHGGPASRDTKAFDYTAQFLASRGYAVAQPQFRGSEGFGLTFEVAGRGEWGRAMQDDITDAVQHLISEGIADPSRICIVGGSYGGYSALAGAAFTPELYRCAASINGVSDLIMMLIDERKSGGSASSSFDYWKESLGREKWGSDGMRDVSPARFADQVEAAVLLIHGKDDTVVSYEHSERMHKQLLAAGKNSELIELEGEDHWLSDELTRITYLESLETFLDKHIGSGWTPRVGDQEASAAGSAGLN